MEIFSNIVSNINNVLWGWPMIILLFGTHIYMTIRTKCVQKKTLKAIKLSVTKDPDSAGDISPFEALSTALASTIGTGNIVGVGTAIALGGPGAVFWCWIAGVFGIATKYAESLVAVKYRVKTKDGRMLGGAMYVLERGLNMKWLGILFAAFASVTAFGIGAGVQVNAISSVMSTTFDPDKGMMITLFGNEYALVPVLVGVIVTIITAVVIFGGVKAISKVCSKLVPLMAVFYVLGCIVILVMNFDTLGEAVLLILKSAFSPAAAAGGLAGAGIMMAARYGIARGLFSNESGMGSAPIVAAAAQTRNPVRQALISSTGTFWDTVVVCLMTGLVLVSSILKNPDISVTGLEGGTLTSEAFAQIPFVGTPILVVGIAAFAYSTILGWSYYGERCIEYIFGKKIMIPYRLVFLFVLLVSPLITLNVVWDVADTLNALMTIPNLVAILLLSKTIAKETDYYLYGKRLDEFDKTEIPITDK